MDPWKDPWQSEGHRGWGDLGFHLTRLVLFATGTAVWLLDTPRPAPPVAVALAGVLVLDRLAQAAPGPQPQGAAARACWP
ncbi:MAG TPA: sensor histidine kinase, partial [Thermaerobacter sp.]